MTNSEFRALLDSVLMIGVNENKRAGFFYMDNLIYANAKDWLKGVHLIVEEREGANVAVISSKMAEDRCPILVEKDGVWYGKLSTLEKVMAEISAGMPKWKPNKTWGCPVVDKWGVQHCPTEQRKAVRMMAFLTGVQGC